MVATAEQLKIGEVFEVKGIWRKVVGHRKDGMGMMRVMNGRCEGRIIPMDTDDLMAYMWLVEGR